MCGKTMLIVGQGLKEAAPWAPLPCRRSLISLLEYFLDLADFLLYLSAYLFVSPFLF